MNRRPGIIGLIAFKAYRLYSKCRTALRALLDSRHYVNGLLALFDTYGGLRLLNRLGLWRGDTVVFRMRNGVSYRVAVNQRAMFMLDETWFSDMYRPNERFVVRDGYTVIDIGANIGDYSIYAAKGASGVKVYAYEPFSGVYRLLTENIEANGLQGAVLPFKLGVADKPGSRRIFISNWNMGGHSMIERQSGGEEEIQVIPLKDVFDQNRIARCDILKIDVEGAEYEILFGLPSEYFPRIGNVCLEYHDAITKPASGRTHEELVKLLEENGYAVTVHKTFNTIYASRTNDEAASGQ